MSLDLMRSEGVAVRPFAGSDELQKILEEQISLTVETAQDSFTLSHSDKLTIPPSEMRVAGISLKVGDIEAILRKVDPMVISRSNVDLLVVAIDGPLSPLRSSEVLYHSKFESFAQELELNSKGVPASSRVLSNAHGRYSIEVALVHNEDIATSSAVKPRRKGALLAKLVFTLKPTGINDQPRPKPMDQQQKSNLGLGPNAWFYIKPSAGIIEAESFEEAFEFFVDKALLDMLKISKPGVHVAVESMLMTTLVQALCYEVAAQLQELDEIPNEDAEDSAVMRMFKQRLGVKSLAEVAQQLEESPTKAATRMLAAGPLLKGIRESLEEAIDE